MTGETRKSRKDPAIQLRIRQLAEDKNKLYTAKDIQAKLEVEFGDEAPKDIRTIRSALKPIRAAEFNVLDAAPAVAQEDAWSLADAGGGADTPFLLSVYREVVKRSDGRLRLTKEEAIWAGRIHAAAPDPNAWQTCMGARP